MTAMAVHQIVIVTPVYDTSPEATQAVTYYGDLRTGAITATLPVDGFVGCYDAPKWIRRSSP